jgi:hypothetical protein
MLTGGGVEPRRRAGTPPGYGRRRCCGGRDVSEPSERGEGASAASAYVMLHRGGGQAAAAAEGPTCWLPSGSGSAVRV